MNDDAGDLQESPELACAAILQKLGKESGHLANVSVNEDQPIDDGDVLRALRSFLLSDLTYRAQHVSEDALNALLVQYCVSSDIRQAIPTPRTSVKEPQPQMTILLLVAKPNELIGARAALDLLDIDPTFISDYPIWQRPLSDSDDDAGVVLSMIADQGPETAINACQTLIRHFKASVAVLCGTTAGMREKTEIGDVLVAHTVVNSEPARLELEGALPRHRDYTIPDSHWRRFAYFMSEPKRWWVDLPPALERLSDEHRPRLLPDAWRPSVQDVHLQSRPKLVADGSLPLARVTVDERVRGSEMEAAGFCNACESLGVRWWVMKGVSDFGDPDSKDASVSGEPNRKIWQFPATVASVVLATTFLRTLR